MYKESSSYKKNKIAFILLVIIVLLCSVNSITMYISYISKISNNKRIQQYIPSDNLNKILYNNSHDFKPRVLIMSNIIYNNLRNNIHVLQIFSSTKLNANIINIKSTYKNFHRILQDIKSNRLDVVIGADDLIYKMCQNGLLFKLPQNALMKLGIIEKNNIDPDKCGVKLFNASKVLAYKELPEQYSYSNTSIFFDTKNYPGKRIIYDSPKDLIEFTILSEGVPKDQIYKELQKPEVLKRILYKIKSIEHSIIWTRDIKDLYKRFNFEKDIVMTLIDSAYIHKLNYLDNFNPIDNIIWDKMVIKNISIGVINYNIYKEYKNNKNSAFKIMNQSKINKYAISIIKKLNNKKLSDALTHYFKVSTNFISLYNQMNSTNILRLSSLRNSLGIHRNKYFWHNQYKRVYKYYNKILNK